VDRDFCLRSAGFAADGVAALGGRYQGWAAVTREDADLSGLKHLLQTGFAGLQVPATWRGRRVFVVVGASDWRTSAWLDGSKLGEHQGGYTPFAMEITPLMKPGTAQRLTMRVDDSDHPFKLE